MATRTKTRASDNHAPQAAPRNAVRRVTGAAGAPDVDSLDRYMSELQRVPLFAPQQELAGAKAIEALEIEHWRALLSHAPALERVGAAIESDAPECAAELRRRFSSRAPARRAPTRSQAARDLAAAARRMRALDTTRQALRVADDAVNRALAGQPSARRYLARLARARDASRQAKSRFVAANLRLVIAMAKRYDRGSLPLADLIQEGNLGLMRAVELFDASRGHRFSTYASWWIRHGLNRALSDKARLVRIPAHALAAASKLERAAQRIAVQTGQRPSLEALASQLNISPDKLPMLRASALLGAPVSLDRNLSHEREQTLHDILPAEDTEPDLELAEWRAELPALLADLTPFEAAIVRLRFGLDDAGEERTLREIGDRYNLSRERIRQIQVEALSKLRAGFLRRHPDQFDGGLAA